MFCFSFTVCAALLMNYFLNCQHQLALRRKIIYVFSRLNKTGIIIAAMRKSKNNLVEKTYFGDLLAGIALSFLGAPYKEATLDEPGREKLIVHFRKFDCFTYVESMLALARWLASGKKSPREYLRQLKLMRYRKGVIDGYSSRLHYFTDWLRDNEKKKIVADITPLLGGAPRRRKIDFMTKNAGRYPALQDKKQFQRMLAVEKNLSRRAFCVMDKKKFGARQEKIRNGDIVAFATAQEGLDVAHVGFALWEGKTLRLLHASRRARAVVISAETLAAYLKGKKDFTGVIIARPL